MIDSIGNVIALLLVAAVAGCGNDVRVATSAVLEIQELVTFAPAMPGTDSSEMVRVSNGGDDELVIFSVEVDGPPGVFDLMGLNDLRLAPNEEAFVTIKYAPQSSSGAQGELTIESNGAVNGTATIVRLEGAAPLTALVVSPNPVEFGRVPAGATAVERVELLNPGNSEITVTQILPLDPSGEFVVAEDYLAELPRTLAPDEEWEVEVAYTPSRDSRDEILLQVEYRFDGDYPIQEDRVTMLANEGYPCIALTHEDGFSFGARLTGETHEEIFTLSNCSAGDDARPLEVSSLGLLRTAEELSADSFSLADAPAVPLRLAPGASSTFLVRYTPTELDVEETAWLEIVSDDAQKTPLVIELTGSGTDNACPIAVANCSVRGEGREPSDEFSANLLTTIDCSAAGSNDPDGDIVGYTWSVITPESSGSTLTSPDQAETSLFIDGAGTYVISLNLLDDRGGEACTIPAVTIFACPCGEDIAIEMFWTTPGDTNPDDTGPGAGSDVDLHFLHVNRGCWNDLTWDCHWRNTLPDWGVAGRESDNAGLDTNDTDGWGPENVNLNDPEPGATYRVGVEYRDDGGYGPSIATVRIYVFGSIVFERSRELPDDNFFWEVADIDWPSGAVTYLDRTYPTIEAASCD